MFAACGERSFWDEVFLYTDISCQPFCVRGHTGCSFTRRTRMNLLMCIC
jgi:hypothetical protein